MANNLPYLMESNWELGTSLDNWSSEADTGGLLNVRHYPVLARYSGADIGPIAPWRGAFCIEFDLGDTNDHTLISSALAIATNQTGFTQFMLFIGKDFRATADDVISIFEAQGAANAQESVIALRIIAATGAVQLASAQTQGDAVTNAVWGAVLPRGQWLCLELVSAVVTGSATGTSQIFVNGTAYNTAVTNANVNTTVARVVLGTQDTLATTLGHLFMDGFKFSTNLASATTTRIGMPHDRYPENTLVTKSTHLALGYSEILNLSFFASGTDNSVKIYDTDSADLQDDTNLIAVIGGVTVAGQTYDLANIPIDAKRGIYVQLNGTVGAWSASIPTTSALVQIGKSQAWRSHGQVRQHGINRNVGFGAVTQ